MAATDDPKTCKCPGCGAVVVLPVDCRGEGDEPQAKRRSQLAQALCGCWVVTLPESELVRLVGTIVGRRGDVSVAKKAAAGGR